jgi:hypothetical protein
MNQYRNRAMREHLDGLAAEDDCGDALATVRSYDDFRSQPFDPAVSIIAW